VALEQPIGVEYILPNKIESKAENKVNYFVRWLIAIVAFAVSVMAFLSFFLAEPKYQITSGIVTLIAIVVVLILSESFNNLSIGKVLTLTNDVKKKDVEKETVKTENKELRQELFKIVSNMQQSQVNNTYNAPSDEWLKALGVVKSDDETDEDEVEESDFSTKDDGTEISVAQIEAKALERSKAKLRRYAVDAGLKKYVSKIPVLETQFVDRVKFSSAFHAIDPIMDRALIFDGYMKSGDSEVFVETRHKDMNSISYFDRLYLMLSKINLYREAKNSNAELLLLMINTPFYETEPRVKTERLIEYFQPAIKNGLLRIEYLDVTEEEALTEANGRQRSLL